MRGIYTTVARTAGAWAGICQAHGIFLAHDLIAQERPAGCAVVSHRRRPRSARGADTEVGLRIEDASARAATYRAQIFVNGWNTGPYVNNVGP
ncbi:MULTISPECIES: beta galactosidase jelly roll domain-containing protein [unclassified Streptomyces]|uniref:beta galactosidase jelly roll domain-containing protein n=1 Tax=unclassified Streptomyces TaxID=2593676 RepID=UPI0022561B1E|nr:MULTISPECIES: beta galactosidase jelly roll domain-containing protein [unclassified Streptomyces]MCX4794903.1 beta galactosidase jelly roll domain-containing protein [Streptomyces sp. NBC_01242]WSP62661.1 beta galactosidase jelly roll domain-containing protein [Streptomyces sp. NBC_01240]WSU21749.1 beta galactosidase jelly roll domain-containing protein [Streptomyces sp. NBC_01108]